MDFDKRIIKTINGYEITRFDNGLIVWWEIWNPNKLDFKSFSRRRAAYAYCEDQEEEKI